MGYEDFSGYIEVEPDDRIQATENHIDFIARRDEDAYLYKNKGEGYFTDFVHLLDVKAVDLDNSDCAFVWVLSNAVDDVVGLRGGEETYVAIVLYNAAGSPRIYLEEGHKNGGGYDVQNDFCSVAVGTTYYLMIKKAGTSLICEIYSDSDRTRLLHTLSLTLGADHSFQYIFAANTLNTGHALQAEVDVDNLDLGGTISGVTRDSSGNALGNCTVWLFRSSPTKLFFAETTSDENGNYSFVAPSVWTYFLRAHKDGSPNVFGVTDDDIAVS